MSGSNGWIGVDLDGTLAHYVNWKGPEHVGEPIFPMVDRVRRWLAEGQEVKVFTARVSYDSDTRFKEACVAEKAIKAWCRHHIGQELEVTCTKDYNMIELWDDRAVQVEMNTGRLIGHSTRGLV